MDKQTIPSVDENGATVEQAPQKKALRFWAGIFDYVEIFVFSVCIVFVLFSMLGRFCLVDGESMNRTLQNTERLLISDVLGDLETGDIVVFHLTGKHDKPLVKRVIATGGQTVQINFDTCQVFVDDTLIEAPNNAAFALDDSYVYLDIGDYSRSYKDQKTGIDKPPVGIAEWEVPEGYVFVMGDNRNNSDDSRSLGCIDERRVLGKVVCRIRPFTWFLD